MADNLDKLYNDLAEADELGDKELAAAIGARIYTAERQKQANEIRTQQRSMGKKTGLGIAEGFKRFGENVEQLLTATAEIGPRGVGMIPEGSTAEQVSKMTTRRFEATQGDPDIEQAADITETGLLMTPIGRASKGASGLMEVMTRAGSRAAAENAVLSGASETAGSPQEVLQERALIAGLGAGLSGPAAILFGAKDIGANYIKKLKDNATKSEATEAALRNRLDIGPLTISQETGSAVARSLEVQIGATKAANFFARQYERFASATDALFESTRRAATTRDPSAVQTANRITKAWQKEKASVISAANAQYGQNVSGAIRTALRDSNKYPIAFDNVAPVVMKWANETGGPWWRKLHPGATKANPEFEQLAEYLLGFSDDAKRFIGGSSQGMSVSGMIRARRALSSMDQDYWRAVNSGKAPTPAELDMHRAVRELRTAMDKDIDAFIDANKGNQRPGVEGIRMFRDANKQHAEFWDNQEFMGRTALGQWFSGGRFPDDPEKALVELADQEPLVQGMAVNMLQKQDPEALLDMRAVLINRGLRDMMNTPTRAVMRGSVDPDSFSKAMTGRWGTLGQQIFSPEEVAKLNRALGTIRIINNAAEGASSVQRSPNLIGAGMAVASRSVPFLTRTLLQLSQLNRLEDLIFDEAGLRSLEVLRDVLGPNNHKYGANDVLRAVQRIGLTAGITGEIPDEVQSAPR